MTYFSNKSGDKIFLLEGYTPITEDTSFGVPIILKYFTIDDLKIYQGDSYWSPRFRTYLTNTKSFILTVLLSWILSTLFFLYIIATTQGFKQSHVFILILPYLMGIIDLIVILWFIPCAIDYYRIRNKINIDYISGSYSLSPLLKDTRLKIYTSDTSIEYSPN